MIYFYTHVLENGQKYMVHFPITWCNMLHGLEFQMSLSKSLWEPCCILDMLIEVLKTWHGFKDPIWDLCYLPANIVFYQKTETQIIVVNFPKLNIKIILTEHLKFKVT